MSGREPEVEVEQESSPGLAEDPRSPRAKQVWIRWRGRNQAVDLSKNTREEIKNWLGCRVRERIVLVLDGKRVRWDDLEEMQEGKVVEVMAEMRGGMGNKKKTRKGKNPSDDENPWLTPDGTEQTEPERVGSGSSPGG